jgi:hypothetical protein
MVNKYIVANPVKGFVRLKSGETALIDEIIDDQADTVAVFKSRSTAFRKASKMERGSAVKLDSSQFIGDCVTKEALEYIFQL